MIITEDEYLAHYGTLHKSGRYPWGSGEDPHQGGKTLIDYVANLRKQGLSDTDIAKGLDIKRIDLQAMQTIAKNEQKQSQISQVNKLAATGMSNMAIGKEMHINESSVRALRQPDQAVKADLLMSTAKMLKEQVDSKGMVDVGKGVEYHAGISRGKLDKSLAILKQQGYSVVPVQIDQLGTQNKTLVKVLAVPGTTYRDIVMNKDKIMPFMQFSGDSGKSWSGIDPPLSIDQSRVKIRYVNEGGSEADGAIYVRPGVSDVSLGSNHYAQVRVVVDNSHYLKGMAIYKDDLPKGVDLVFNTVKKNTGNKLDAMKPLKQDSSGKVDEANPFGAVVRQIKDFGPDGKEHVSSAMNLVNSEGVWSTWKKTLSAQMLSKQSPQLAKTQLDMKYEQKKLALDEITSLTNPAVRIKLLESFADAADSSAVHLEAAHLPRQSSHVILPVESMKESEVYAPKFDNGERVVLIRFPHGGPFEIPQLVVNNRNPEAKKLLGLAPDAIGINAKVAARLSGADFDGDSVLVIPNDKNLIKTAPALAALKDFSPQDRYPKYEGMKSMDAATKGFQMGDISNLITDMTIRGASPSELARAVQHSMVVIDAEKHDLNYRQSAIDFNIKQLKVKYQNRANGGASTLISRATARADPNQYKLRAAKDGGPIDRKTGKLVYEPTGESYIRTSTNKKTGIVTDKVIFKTQRSMKLAETDNAHTLSSGTPIEKIYADHSNKLKALANLARYEMVNTKTTPMSDSAKAAYKPEVESLKAKLALALRNAPLERQAQIIAGAKVSALKSANTDMSKADIKKLKFLALETARLRTGASKVKIGSIESPLTTNEWQAIQAGAISNHMLQEILNNANLDRIKELATPRVTVLMTSTKKSRAMGMLASGYTQAEVATALGVSVSTLMKSMEG